MASDRSGETEGTRPSSPPSELHITISPSDEAGKNLIIALLDHAISEAKK